MAHFSRSLHGWKYCNREDGFGLAVWLLVIVASMSSAAYMVTINCINFYRVCVTRLCAHFFPTFF